MPAAAATVTAVLVGYDGPAERLAAAVASLGEQTLIPSQIQSVDSYFYDLKTFIQFKQSLGSTTFMKTANSGGSGGYPAGGSIYNGGFSTTPNLKGSTYAVADASRTHCRPHRLHAAKSRRRLSRREGDGRAGSDRGCAP